MPGEVICSQPFSRTLLTTSSDSLSRAVAVSLWSSWALPSRDATKPVNIAGRRMVTKAMAIRISMRLWPDLKIENGKLKMENVWKFKTNFKFFIETFIFEFSTFNLSLWRQIYLLIMFFGRLIEYAQ